MMINLGFMSFWGCKK